MGIQLINVLNLIVLLFGFASFVFFALYFGFDFKKAKERIRLSRELKENFYNSDWLQYSLLKQYHNLLSSSFTNYKTVYFSRIIFYQVSSLLLLILTGYILLETLVWALIISLSLTVIFPILLLWIRHKSNQNKIQIDILDSLNKLLEQYQLHEHNMLYALKNVSSELDGPTKSLFAKLFTRFHGTKRERELAVESFAFSVGDWGSQIAHIIYKAYEGYDVELLLKETIEDMTAYNRDIIDSKTDGFEVALLGYFPIPLLIIFILLEEAYVLRDGLAYYYHFIHPEGRLLLAITFIFGIINLIMAYVIGKPKRGL